MAFITQRRHWDVVTYEATHVLKNGMELREFGTGKTEHFPAGTPVHLKGSRKANSGVWECLVLTPKYYRGKKCKNGFRTWFALATDLQRISPA